MDTLKEIEPILNKFSFERTSLFQLNFFILGKEPTIQAKLQKCISELSIRKSSVEAAFLEIDEGQDNIDLLKLKLKKIVDSDEESLIEIRKIKRRISHHQKTLETTKSRIDGLLEEIQFFYEAYKELVKIEEHQPWDSDEVQLEYWDAKYGRDIRERILLQLPIDMELVRSILVLPDQSKTKIQTLQLLQKQHDKLVENKPT